MTLIHTLRRHKTALVRTALLAALVVLVKATILAPPKVTTVRVERRDLTARVYGNGTVEAKEVVGVSSKVTGRIVSLHADQGDRVRRGQILARLESDEYAAQLGQAEAGVSRAAAGQSLEAATLAKARANLELAERNAARYRNLADRNLVSRQEAEQYETAWRLAREEEARSSAALEAARMESAAGRAARGVARSRLDDTVIRAPRDGIIVSRDLEKGAVVSPGQSIFTLADPAVVWVRAHVDESQLAGVAVGREAAISLRSAPERAMQGRVARVGMESDRVTEELAVDVAFAAPPPAFRLGEQSDVLITVGTKRGVPSLPAAALTSHGGKHGVWTVSEGRLRFKPVQVGIEDRQGVTEILSGLAGAEPVVLPTPAQAKKFRDGMKVRVSP
ncbi:efflux RND transporter periplasmic adaptor subunit [Geobacter sulfurreducens]|jgi:HlyD family secretion protein|uniref:Efflux pump, RND family, membrane fusion protein n=1 Tax=Geobacter sulfurreducens (strain ATCC 51573 / DSM 12127 / PCA) TaxID=243231 RepID=Q74EL3_GEOSL|nr:efflux RND transporter periplasmic adaptor subunit [Geobacter sulfurreducens]AAR34276.1 efflux pump, RND family, membrane fusion protein [Geobacter sulfurreducens PCA]AJY70688.1 RND transporter [Geobacter sulfurreducens]UAC05005.1 efflux RND transporter periplasmic adaptor subunit [Geobacter sulfurreducens]HCD96708.1 efflux RND transporter periplasmic adaptor subunit [Geobacter sulfurreducens]HML79105.1 efflux RND transporter periplasmic adaptor subunit [Geobacter sulfurreducens]